MDCQRLRNLTTGRLHTEMGHVYEDLEIITGESGLWTHMLPRLKEGIDRILGLDGGEKFTVNKICVSGESDETESKEVVDLIRDRMVERRQVEQDSNRTLPYDSRREYLRDCWTKRQPELNTMFSNEG